MSHLTNQEKAGLTWLFIGLCLLIASGECEAVRDVAEWLNNALVVASLAIWLGGLVAFIYGLWEFNK